MQIKKVKFYMWLAEKIAEHWTCLRAKVGCILVKNDCIISTWYNWTSRGSEHCSHESCKSQEHCLNTIHAETNAVIQAAKNGVSTEWSIAICTHYPCYYCKGILINAGIKSLYYSKEYKGIIEWVKLSEYMEVHNLVDDELWLERGLNFMVMKESCKWYM